MWLEDSEKESSGQTELSEVWESTDHGLTVAYTMTSDFTSYLTGRRELSHGMILFVV